jgi:hypothetical protein
MTAFSHTMVGHLVGASSRTELPITLHYRATEPYEVTVMLGAERVEWKLSRELLRAGTMKPVGGGDVHFWPGRQSPTEQLFLHLSPPSGEALVELPRTAVLEFLQETERLVPTGTEGAAISPDAELQALLDSDAP